MSHTNSPGSEAPSSPPLRLEYQGVSINQSRDMVSLTDMWRAARAKHDAEGKDPAEFDHRRVPEWIRSKAARQFIEAVRLMVGNSHVMLSEPGKSGATFAHWQIGLAYAKYLSPAFHLWCNTVVREKMEQLHATPTATLALDIDALKANARLSASAAVGATKSTIVPHVRQIEGKVAHLDERLTDFARWSQQVRRETNGKIDAILTFITKPSAVALQFNDYIEIGGVCEVAGVPPTVARRGILSANIRRSLDNYTIDQRALPAHATVRGVKVRHWPKATVADWLAAEGHALIERHLRANAAKPKLVSIDNPNR